MKPVRLAVALVATACLAGSLLLTAVRFLDPWLGGRGPLIVAFAPYALIGYAVAAVLLLLLWRGSRPPLPIAGAAIALAGVAVHAVLLAPAHAGKHPSGPADVTVMTLNLRFGRADVGEALALARREKVDVLVTEETTPEAYERLIAAGARDTFAHQAGSAAPGASGTLVLSRLPVVEEAAVPVTLGGHRVRVGGEHPFTLLAIHTAQPLNSPGLWRTDHVSLRRAVAEVDGPMVLTGDLNATLDHRQMRDLLGDGLVDAARQSNAGWQPTWPSDPDVAHGLPGGIGLIAIDHVLVRGGPAAVGTSTSRVSGTDHRALVARLSLG